MRMFKFAASLIAALAMSASAYAQQGGGVVGIPPFTGCATWSSTNILTGTGSSCSGGSGTVTSVGFTGGLISVATPTTTPAFTVAGTSGGIPYFASASTWASSGVLAANALVVGGGAGVAPSTTTTGAGILTFLGTPSSANLATAVTDETGSGSLVFGTTPTLATPVINGLPTGTGIATANTVSTVVARDGSGNFAAGTITASLTGVASGNLVSGGALGTPSSGTLTNATGLPTAGIATLTTGTAPAAGKLGQVISATTTAASPVTYTTSSTAIDIVSVTLSAGTWACTANPALQLTSTTVTSSDFSWISLTSATLPAAPNSGGYRASYTSKTGNNYVWEDAVGTFFVNVSGSTTVYLSGLVGYAGTAPVGYGTLNCLRVG